MISDKYTLRPRYGEVDRMGYVYHANYVAYCHQARTELMRKLGINDKLLEDNQIMMPVLTFEIKYKKPSFYDDLLTIETIASEKLSARCKFEYTVFNEDEEVVCTAVSTVAFIASETRKPIRIPDLVKEAFSKFDG